MRGNCPQVQSRGARLAALEQKGSPPAIRTPEGTSALPGFLRPLAGPSCLEQGIVQEERRAVTRKSFGIRGRPAPHPGGWRDRAANQNRGLGAGVGASLSLARLEPLLSRVFGVVGEAEKSRAAWSVRAARPRYLECPGQHPHRDSLHGLPLLETRRVQLVPGRQQQGTARGARAGRGTDSTGEPRHHPPGPAANSSHLSKDAEEAAHSLPPAWKRKESPIFGEK